MSQSISGFLRHSCYLLLLYASSLLLSSLLSRSPLPSTLSLQEDKKRMISFFEASLRDEAKRTQEPMDSEICDKLRTMINLTESFQAPIDGIDGLLG
jgi:hypothetical protein